MMSQDEINFPRIGAHKSIAKGIDKAVDRGIASTCECLQIFTRSPRSWALGSKLNKEKTKTFLEKAKKANYYDTAIHMPYLPNLASPNSELYQKSIQVLIEEIEKSFLLKAPYIISHLGSPKEKDRQFAVERVSEAINKAMKTIKSPTMILLENSTAKKKKWGKYVEDIADIMNHIDNPQFIGMCFDTAHAFASGYDISTSEGLHEVFDKIDDLLGKEKVKIIHLNDSKGALDSGIDHHEHIGKGKIGVECFRELMQDSRFKQMSMILETPVDDIINDKINLNFLRSLRNQ